MRRPELPSRGIAAHRGGTATHPENTLAAFREAIALGVHQIEFDVRRSADGELVVIHDAEVDRTTDGRGRVADLTWLELRRLDAGGWKHARFAGERIPTLCQALGAMARDLWVNVQIKYGEPIGAEVARVIAEAGRLQQCFLSCGNSAGAAARAAHGEVLVCNLARQRSREEYLEHAIATGSSFIQLHHLRGLPEAELVESARAAGLRVTYFCRPELPELDRVFRLGVDFALVDDLERGLTAARRVGIEPLRR
jgi:glycerophosphoryl diester phosphodiesterase